MCELFSFCCLLFKFKVDIMRFLYWHNVGYSVLQDTQLKWFIALNTNLFLSMALLKAIKGEGKQPIHYFHLCYFYIPGIWQECRYNAASSNISTTENNPRSDGSQIHWTGLRCMEITGRMHERNFDQWIASILGLCHLTHHHHHLKQALSIFPGPCHYSAWGQKSPL